MAVAERGDCTRSKVGAVVLGADHRVAGAGYNGAPPGMRGCLDGTCPRGRHYAVENEDSIFSSRLICACGGPWPCPEYVPPGGDYGDCIALHAELNACIDAGRRRARGGTIYVTRKPCRQCVKVIQAAGITGLVYPHGGQVARFRAPFDWQDLL